MSAGLLISYFDPSSKAFDYQSKNPGARGLRVANLTRKALPTRGFEKVAVTGPFDAPFATLADALQTVSTYVAFYNAPSMQVHM